MLCSLALLTGQSIAQSNDDNKKVEGFAGYSFESGDGLNGFNVSGVYNVTRYIGIKGDFSAAFKGERVGYSNTVPAFDVSFRLNRSLYNVLGGIQIKDNANKGRFKPFAHALFGVGVNRSRSSDFQCSPTANCPTFVGGSGSSTGFASALGGGVDIRLNNRIQIRVIQLDYNPVTGVFGTTTHNVRFGAGIVF